MNIVLKLKDLREDHDLTQKDVAVVIGTTPQYYQKYHTSTDYLLGRTNIKEPYSSQK